MHRQPGKDHPKPGTLAYVMKLGGVTTWVQGTRNSSAAHLFGAESRFADLQDAERQETEGNRHARPVPAGSVDVDAVPCQSGHSVSCGSGTTGNADMP